jgi:hypothetical protein
MRQSAVVESEIGDDAGFLIGAVGADEGALVFGMVDEATLLKSAFGSWVVPWGRDQPTSSSLMVISRACSMLPPVLGPWS